MLNGKENIELLDVALDVAKEAYKELDIEIDLPANASLHTYRESILKHIEFLSRIEFSGQLGTHCMINKAALMELLTYIRSLEFQNENRFTEIKEYKKTLEARDRQIDKLKNDLEDATATSNTYWEAVVALIEERSKKKGHKRWFSKKRK